jgi:two-component system chemotaxis sensor kinase CheA
MVRLVRDLSKKLGKEVTITLSGEETEIDKNMVELVADPLMHMVRNSLDHGIESRNERIAKGKPPGGKIELSAFHKGGYVVIEIKDDGGGLRRDKILKKAIESGIVQEGENLPDNRIFNLIFEPGFSTAEKVTDVSGRGVGMDVVKKNIDKLRGKVDIASEEGKGSVFSIYLPITLAIIEGIIVRTGVERYILPINSVVEFVRPNEADHNLVYDKGEMYKAYDKVYPLIYLNRVTKVAGENRKLEDGTICIVDSDYGRACVVVDEVLGQQQVVIKSLGEKLKHLEGVSGAAILSDGRVGLILDVNSLVALSVKQ